MDRITIEGLQRQRAWLSRCRRSIAFDFALAVLGDGDTTELRGEWARLGVNIEVLDRWIGEAMIADRARWAVEGVERMLEL